MYYDTVETKEELIKNGPVTDTTYNISLIIRTRNNKEVCRFGIERTGDDLINWYGEVVVNNSYYNNKLNNLIDEFYSLDYDNMDYNTISGDLDNGEYYCSREYLNDIMSRNMLGFLMLIITVL